MIDNTGTRRCPECHRLPDVEIIPVWTEDLKEFFKMIAIKCSGHVVYGRCMPQAIEGWNMFVEQCLKASEERMKAKP